MNIYIETITPGKAAEMLAHPNNRNFRRRSADAERRYAADMAAGRWDLNGETIKLNGDGSLIDGQTRLRACVAAGVPFTTVIVRGVKNDANIDRGRQRTLAQILEAAGEKNCRTLAGAIRWLHEFEQPKIDSRGGRGATIPPLLATLFRHPSVRHWTTVSLKARTVLSAVTLAPVLTLGTYPEGETDDLKVSFVEAIGEGANLGPGDPAFVLRARLLDDRKAKLKMTGGQRMAITVIAWNHYRVGRAASAHSIRWREVGAARQEFPRPE